MKVTNVENKKLSDAIDQMQEGLDTFIDLYNQSEEDKPLLRLDDETNNLLQEAINEKGSEVINQSLNTIIKKVLIMASFKDEQVEGHDDE